MRHAATAAAIDPADDLSSGGRLVDTDGRTLPLLGAALAASAAGGLCRVVLTQRFVNPHADPLRVTYLFPLPHDGVVSGFAFTLGGRRVVGEVDRLAAARERFEEALVLGRTAGLVEQVRGSLFQQELGNLPPGAELVAELTVDQRLTWLPEGAWEWRFPTTVAPRYQGAPGRSPDAARQQVEVAAGHTGVRLTLALEVADPLSEGGRVTSPTHALSAAPEGGLIRVALVSEGGVPLDRDVAIRWPVAAPEVGASVRQALATAGARVAGRSFGLLTLTPPRPEGVRAVRRDLTVLLDTSGSMGGEPLDQARAVVAALVGSLGDQDQLELIEFSDRPRRWTPKPVAATAKARSAALAWLAALEAGSSTEMTDALYEALRPLRAGSQRQVVLVTDGQIGFEAEIVRALLQKLPPGSRLHTVGVGSGVNRSLTGPAARAGRGVEVVVDLGESPDAAAARLLARTVAPVVTELTLGGTALRKVASARPPDLFAGAPALLPVELDPAGGTLTVRGRTAEGRFERTLLLPPCEVAPGALGAALAPLFAREQVEELELEAAAGKKVDGRLERLGLEFQIATRRTTWVAISEEATVDPRQPTRRETMPQQLPHGTSVAGLGLRGAGAVKRAALLAAPSAPMLSEFSVACCAPSPLSLRDELDDELGSSVSQEEVDDVMKLFEGRGAGEVPPAEPGQPARVLQARLLQWRDGALVLEIDVPEGGLEWRPGRDGRLTLEFGRFGSRLEVAAQVDLAASTGDGPLTAGQVIRLRLLVAAPNLRGKRPTRVQLADGTRLQIVAPPAS